MTYVFLWFLAPIVALRLASVWLSAPANDLQLLAQILIVSEVLSIALAGESIN
jgi:hypothetical protein